MDSINIDQLNTFKKKILLGAQIIHEDKKFSLKNKNKNPYTQENFGNKIQKWQMEM